MLNGMRAASKNWIGRTLMALVMGVIVISFAVWGIGDIFRGIGQGKLAQVGAVEISTDAYRQAYQNELQQLQRRLRRNVTNAQAREAGLDQQVLSRLVTEAALDQKAHSLGLAMSDAEVAKTLSTDPMFKGPKGDFDKTRFDALLRDNGYNERSFVREQRANYLRREIADAVVGKMTTPDIVTSAIDRFRNETRSIDYVILAPSANDAPPTPTPEDLKTYFEAHNANFYAPEYRKIVVLALTPATLARNQQVSDADIQKLYESVRAQRYGSPERRAVAQIIYPTIEEAQAAFDKTKAGASFASLIEARNLKAGDVDLGLVSREQISDPAVASAAFALKPDEISAPISGAFGFSLLKVSKIEPEAFKAFADVSASLKNEIAEERARKSMQVLQEKVEDQRASGKPLVEAAQNAGLTAQTFDAVDAQGHDRSGAPPRGLPLEKELMPAVFASDIGVDNATIETRNGYIWYEVLAIDPARQRTLDEAGEAVAASWVNEETEKRLANKAGELVQKIKDGAGFAKLAADMNLVLRHNGNVKRTGAEGLGEPVIVQIFNQPNGGAASVGAPGGRLVFQVLDSATSEFNPDTEANKKIAEQMRQQIADDILGQYVQRLETDYGVKVNDSAFRAVSGGGEP